MTELALMILRKAIQDSISKKERCKKNELSKDYERKANEELRENALKSKIKAMKKQEISLLITRLETLSSMPHPPVIYRSMHDTWDAAKDELLREIAILKKSLGCIQACLFY